MAVCIPNDVIDVEKSTFLVDNLTFKGKYNVFSGYGNDSEKQEYVSCYKTVDINGKKYLIVPYFFGLFFSSKFKLPIFYNRTGMSRDRCIQREYNFKGTLRDYQYPLVCNLTNNLNVYKATLLKANPGAGKTVMACFITCHYKLVTLIVICFRFQHQQFVKTYEDLTDAKVCRVDELKDNDETDYDVYVCMITSLHKLPERARRKMGFLVVDEFHLMYTQNRVTKLLDIDTVFLLGLTATPDGGSGNLHEIHKAFFGPSRVIKKFDGSFNVYMINTLIDPTYEITKRGGPSWSVYQKSLFYNKQRNDFIVHTIVNNPSKKCLILTSEKDHVKLLHSSLLENGVRASTFYGTDKSYQDNDVLIGTVSKMGTAFDEETFCSTFLEKRLELLFYVSSYKNLTTIEQTCGRVLRACQPSIIYLRDNGGIASSHWKSFKKWSKELNVTYHDHTVDLREYHEDHNNIQTFLEQDTRCVAYVSEVNIYGMKRPV
jgi:superfamily II DNA or RNA helicase